MIGSTRTARGGSSGSGGSPARAFGFAPSRRGVACAAAATLIGMAAAPIGWSAAPERATSARSTVRVGNNFFSPTSKSVRRGGTLTWVWAGGVRHNVTGMTRSGRVVFMSRTTSRRGFRYRHRFGRRGRFRVICTVHPRVMRMTVRVR
jgi:plastocyanin